jgi:hypothetical protein
MDDLRTEAVIRQKSEQGHVAGALNIPVSQLEWRPAELPAGIASSPTVAVPRVSFARGLSLFCANGRGWPADWSGPPDVSGGLSKQPNPAIKNYVAASSELGV